MDIKIQEQYGIEALKNFVLRVLDLAKLDKDGDGQISTSEWGQAVFALVPELLNIKQLTNEGRDLTVEEVTVLIETVSQNFPDYRNLKNEVEDVIRAALRFLAITTYEGYQVIKAVKRLNKKPIEIEVNTEALPAGLSENKPSGQSKKDKTAGKK